MIARAFEEVPDEAFFGFSIASIFTAIGLYLVDRRDESFMVALLGPAFAVTCLLLKVLGTGRSLARR